MPTDPNHAYADTAHPLMRVGAGYLYGCNSARSGDTRPRGRTTTAWMQDGWRVLQRGEIVTREPVMIEVTTHWNELTCGHLVEPERGPDTACNECANRTF